MKFNKEQNCWEECNILLSRIRVIMLSKLKGIDFALYIFILIAFGYVVTLLYQWGYNNFFYIPASFIELSVKGITKSFILLGVFLSVIILNVIFLEDKTDLK
jgi:hypothetical protein